MSGVPEQALAAFEAMTGSRATVYSADPEFFFAFPNAGIHPHAVCAEAKKAGHELECIRFCHDGAFSEAWKYPDGFFRICPAGFLECVMPVCGESRLLCVMMAGCGTDGIPPDGVPVVRAEKRFPGAEKFSGDGCGRVRLAVSPAVVLEAMRQLAARLREWHASGGGANPDSRGEILEYMLRKHSLSGLTLGMLARKMCLSESRTAHLVREMTNLSLRELILKYKLTRASRLLQVSSNSIAETARASGFSDVSNFSRIFRARFGATPSAFRRKNRA